MTFCSSPFTWKKSVQCASACAGRDRRDQHLFRELPAKVTGQNRKAQHFLVIAAVSFRTKTSSTVFPQGWWLSSALILLGSETLVSFNIPYTPSFRLHRQCPQWERILQALLLDGMTIELDDLIMHLPGSLGDSWLGLGYNLWLWNRAK